MSSSRLKPSVTPSTALAMRLRARPWNLLDSGLSPMFVATRSVPDISKEMPGGTPCFIAPFGPLNSTTSFLTVTVTPLGTAMGFLPIRDISSPLPDVAKHFAADAGFRGFLAGHDTARRRENRGAEAAHDARHFLGTEVAPAA